MTARTANQEQDMYELEERIAGYLAGGWGRSDSDDDRQRDCEWYAVVVESGRERVAHAHLAERRFTCFMPMRTQWHKPPGSPREPRSSPLMPGYLFVLCAPEDFATIQGLEGVISFVRYDREDGAAWPFPIPLSDVLRLQIEERMGAFDYTRKVRYRYVPKKGEMVKIGAGPYFGFVAKVLATPQGQRAKLLIEGFGAARHRTEDVAHLSAA